jgi:hypothetical protein
LISSYPQHNQAIITGTALIPRMVTRFLLVTSLSVLDLEAFDAVLEVRMAGNVCRWMVAVAEFSPERVDVCVDGWWL